MTDRVPRLRAALAVRARRLAGLALALSFEPYDLPLLLPIGVAGFTLALHEVRPRRGAWLGLLTGAAFMYVHLFWMRSVGYDAWVLLGTLETVFFAPLGAAVAAVSRLRGWPVWTAAALGDAWRSGARRTPSAACPGAGWPSPPSTRRSPRRCPTSGATGVSLLVALRRHDARLGGAAFRGTPPARSPRARSRSGPRCCCRCSRPTPRRPDGEITVAAVQGNVPGPGTDILYDHRQVTRNHVDTTIRLAADAEAGEVPAPDLVLWPENATALDPFRDASLNEQIREAVAAVNVPILVGAIVDDPRPGKILNQGIVWNPVTGAADRYTKRHPVPYGEYIPWRDSNPLTSRFDELARVARDMQAGTRVDPLMISGVPVADAICFDVAYDEGIYAQLRAGAPAARRPDLQRDVQPHQPARPAVRHHPRARHRDRPARRRRLDQRDHRDHRARRHPDVGPGPLDPGVRRRAGPADLRRPAGRSGSDPRSAWPAWSSAFAPSRATLLPYRRTSARAPAARVMASSVADRPPTDEDHP